VYPDNQNRASDITCVVFIFIYALGYSMGFGPAAWVYGSEVSSTRSSLITPMDVWAHGDPDLSNLSPSSRTQLLGIWRRHRLYRRCPGLAGRYRPDWVPNLLLFLRR
jgi:hypothetical protein